VSYDGNTSRGSHIAAMCDRIFAVAEHIRNQPTKHFFRFKSLLMRVENSIAAGRGHFDKLL